MRDYGRVFCAIWGSNDFRSLTEDGRALVLYLLTCPHTTMIGAFPLPIGYLVEDIQWKPERIEAAFAELFRKGFATVCEATRWVWIHKYLEWNEPDNPNQWKAARKLAAKIPSCSWLDDFAEYFEAAAASAQAENSKPLRNRSRTVSKPGTGTGTGEGSGEGEGTGTVKGSEPPLQKAVDNSNGHAREPGDFSGQNSPPEDPPSRRGPSAERRNGDFEAINQAVSKLLAEGGYVPADTRGIARALHCSVKQVEVAIKQLRDRGRMPAGVAA